MNFPRDGRSGRSQAAVAPTIGRRTPPSSGARPANRRARNQQAGDELRLREVGEGHRRGGFVAGEGSLNGASAVAVAIVAVVVPAVVGGRPSSARLWGEAPPVANLLLLSSAEQVETPRRS